MNDLHKYYNRKSSLDVQHSEKIIDIFRFCIRKDKVLPKVLDKFSTGFDEDVMEVEVEPQSKMEWQAVQQRSISVRF